MNKKQHTDLVVALIHSRLERCGNIDEADADLDRLSNEIEFGELDAEVNGPFAGRTLVEFFVR